MRYVFNLDLEDVFPGGRPPPKRFKRALGGVWKTNHTRTWLIAVILLSHLSSGGRGDTNAADFVVSPVNQAVVDGDSAQFDCTPAKDGDIGNFQWIDGNRDAAMTSGKTAFPPYEDEITLLLEENTKRYGMYINTTTSTAARQYGCRRLYPPLTYYSELLVLDQDPKCQTVPDPTDLVEGDPFTIDCVASYTARWEADVTCTDNINWSRLDMDKSKGTKGNLRATNRTEHVTDDLHGHGFTCKVFFPAPADGDLPKDDDRKKYNRDAPSYSFLFKTGDLDVKFPVRDIQIPDQKPDLVYNPGDTVTCQANGRPLPKISWVDVQSGDRVAGSDLDIVASMEGLQEYRCEAENTIRTEVYSINKTLSFEVKIPTTTPTTTPSTTTTTTPEPTEPVPPPAGLSGGAIAGIVVGVVAAILLIVLVILLLTRRSRKKAPKEKPLRGRDNKAAVWTTPPPKAPVTQPDILPPTTNYDRPPAEVEIDNVPGSRRPLRPLYDHDYSYPDTGV